MSDDSAAAAALLKQGKADVWIPDSRVRAILAGTTLAAAAPSIAVSPIVIVANSSLNTSRFTKTPLTWSSLLNQGTLSPLHVEIQNNATSSTALVAGVRAERPCPRRHRRQVPRPRIDSRGVDDHAAGELRTRSPPPRCASRRRGSSREQPNTKILSMTGGYPQLDYPWVARPGASATAKAATAQLLKALQGPSGDAARKQQGLLNPGTVAVEPGDYAGTQRRRAHPGARAWLPSRPSTRSPTPAPRTATCSPCSTSPGRWPTPPAPDKTSKMQAVQNSAKIAVQLLSPQTRLGLWEFTYQLDPPHDYKQVVPIAPLSTNRTTLLNALDAATPIPTGGTSLYRTVLDAYQYMQTNWNANYANTVIVFTDGKDETDPGAPSLADVQAQLKAIQDPKRPIQLIMLGYGEADIAAMDALTSTVGGVVYHINSPTQIVGAFIDSISQSVLHSLGQS